MTYNIIREIWEYTHHLIYLYKSSMMTIIPNPAESGAESECLCSYADATCKSRVGHAANDTQGRVKNKAVDSFDPNMHSKLRMEDYRMREA